MVWPILMSLALTPGAGGLSPAAAAPDASSS